MVCYMPRKSPSAPVKIITRSNGKQYAEIKAPGVGRKRISLRTKSVKEAKARAAEADLPRLERALQAGALSAGAISALTLGRRVTLAQLLDKWTDAAKYRNESPATTFANRKVVEAWFRAAGVAKLAPAALEPAHLYDFINAADDRSQGTRRRQLGALMPFLTFVNTTTHALRPEILEVRVNLRVMSHGQREKKEVRPFTAVEQDAILAHLDHAYGEALKDAAADPGLQSLADIAAFWFFGTHLARSAGLRLGDIAQLEWACLGQPGALIVWTDKRDRRVCLPLTERVTPGLRAVLARLPESGDPRFVFPALAERYEDPAKRSWFSVTYGRILAGLGIEGATFHSWRHTAVSRWRAEGFDLEACADYAGHGSTKTTEGYVHT